MVGERIDNGFHMALPFIRGFTIGQGADVEIPLIAEDNFQTLQLGTWKIASEWC